MKQLARVVKGWIAYDLGIMEKRFFWKTNKYLSKYYSSANEVAITKKKIIIYMLDGRVYSGGLSDIIKGILSMYKFSKEIGYDFRINFCFPYNLSDYLTPNSYNWYISENEVSYNSHTTAYLWIYNSHANYGKTKEYETTFQRKVLGKFLKKNNSKTQFHIYTNSEWISDLDYQMLFNELFKPVSKIEHVLEHHRGQLKEEYMSMTFRFQQLLGDFKSDRKAANGVDYLFKTWKKASGKKDKDLPEFGELQFRAMFGNGDFKNKRMPMPLEEGDKYALIEKCINQMINFRLKNFPKKRILVTSDSEIFLKKVSYLKFAYVIPREVAYKMQNFPQTEDIFLKAYIDLLLLSGAKKIYLLQTDSMYRSGFAKNASLLNNKEYEEIIF